MAFQVRGTSNTYAQRFESAFAAVPIARVGADQDMSAYFDSAPRSAAHEGAQDDDVLEASLPVMLTAAQLVRLGPKSTTFESPDEDMLDGCQTMDFGHGVPARRVYYNDLEVDAEEAHADAGGNARVEETEGAPARSGDDERGDERGDEQGPQDDTGHACMRDSSDDERNERTHIGDGKPVAGAEFWQQVHAAASPQQAELTSAAETVSLTRAELTAWLERADEPVCQQERTQIKSVAEPASRMTVRTTVYDLSDVDVSASDDASNAAIALAFLATRRSNAGTEGSAGVVDQDDGHDAGPVFSTQRERSQRGVGPTRRLAVAVQPRAALQPGASRTAAAVVALSFQDDEATNENAS